MAHPLLETILADVRSRLRERQRRIPLETLRKQVEGMPRPPAFGAALRDEGRPVRVIAELKRASPSRGWIRQDLDPATVAAALAAAGAAALSVLTEEDHFMGSPAGLRAAAGAVTIPVLRKDFLVEDYQVYEARAWGAAAVLLIAAVLDDRQLASLLQTARDLGLDVLAEAHTAEERQRLTDAGADIIGINCRDLNTFTLDRERTAGLLRAIPPGCVRVAESGVRNPGDLAALQDAGAEAFLVGETLMRAPQPADALRELLSGATKQEQG